MSSVAEGYYSDVGEPLLELALAGPEGRRFIVDALIDTGFTRSLLILETHARQANLPPTRRASDTIYLGDGTRRSASWTFGYVEWFGQLTEMEILVVASSYPPRQRCLLGRELLRGTDLRLGSEKVEIRR